MKWFNELIDGKIKQSINKEVVRIESEFSLKLYEIKEDLFIYIDNFNKQITILKKENEEIQQSFSGLIKTLDKNLESFGDKKGIVTSLLKRIAELEGMVEDVHK